MQAGNLEKLLREGKIYSCRYCLLATRQEDKPLEGGEAAASGSQSSEGQSPGEIQDASTEEIPNPPGSSSSREKSSDKEKGKKPRYLDKGSKTTFSFDGLRSHAKEK